MIVVVFLRAALAYKKLDVKMRFPDTNYCRRVDTYPGQPAQPQAFFSPAFPWS
jgi:hypothetical protein